MVRHRPRGRHGRHPPRARHPLFDPARGLAANAQPVSFVLAGIAFFVADLLVLVDYRRSLLYLVGIPFTGIQVVLYFVLNWPNVLSPGGVVDKVVQVTLIAVLVVLYRREG